MRLNVERMRKYAGLVRPTWDLAPGAIWVKMSDEEIQAHAESINEWARTTAPLILETWPTYQHEARSMTAPNEEFAMKFEKTNFQPGDDSWLLNDEPSQPEGYYLRVGTRYLAVPRWLNWLARRLATR